MSCLSRLAPAWIEPRSIHSSVSATDPTQLDGSLGSEQRTAYQLPPPRPRPAARLDRSVRLVDKTTLGSFFFCFFFFLFSLAGMGMVLAHIAKLDFIYIFFFFLFGMGGWGGRCLSSHCKTGVVFLMIFFWGGGGGGQGSCSDYNIRYVLGS